VRLIITEGNKCDMEVGGKTITTLTDIIENTLMHEKLKTDTLKTSENITPIRTPVNLSPG